MIEYLLVFFVLLAVSLGFFYFYRHFLTQTPKSVSELYLDGLRDLLDGDEIKAFGKLRQVVAEDASNIDAYLRLGQILRANKKPERALQVHKDLTLRTGLGSEDKQKVLRQLAEDYIDLKDYDTARAALNELISLAPQEKWALRRLLSLQEREGRWDEAFDTATRIQKAESDRSKKPLAVYKFNMVRSPLSILKTLFSIHVRAVNYKQLSPISHPSPAPSSSTINRLFPILVRS